MTNGDAIRLMSDEEICKEVTQAGFSRCRFCDLGETMGNQCFKNGREQCRENILAWLRKEVAPC